MKKLGLVILLFFGLFTFTQADEEKIKSNHDIEIDKHVVKQVKYYFENRLYYYKDYRTNFCFAYLVDEFSIVPCTPEVEKLLVNK